MNAAVYYVQTCCPPSFNKCTGFISKSIPLIANAKTFWKEINRKHIAQAVIPVLRDTKYFSAKVFQQQLRNCKMMGSSTA